MASHDTVSGAGLPQKLTRSERETLLADFLPYVETMKIERTPEGLPEIRDTDDIIFLAFAAAAHADALVSGNSDIFAVRGQFQMPILTVSEFADWLQRNGTTCTPCS